MPEDALVAPGPRVDHGDAGAAGELAPRFRGHRRAALLAAERDGDLRIVKRVEQRQIAFAGNAEDALDAVLLQRLDDQSRGGLVPGTHVTRFPFRAAIWQADPRGTSVEIGQRRVRRWSP